MSEQKSKSCEIDHQNRTAELLKALGHPVRIKVVNHLLARECCCCGDLCDGFEHSQSTISQHLGVLKDAGVLTAEKDGTRMLYSIDPSTFSFLETVFADMNQMAKGRGR
ncbi:MAG: metalloregulator ArsR/SmtB family transcription factor [Rhizobiaceae bacterium]|nr:metalloregulator ArsR/SmtB family transcription factor [Rhizobiaceae bacterium]